MEWIEKSYHFEQGTQEVYPKVILIDIVNISWAK